MPGMGWSLRRRLEEFVSVPVPWDVEGEPVRAYWLSATEQEVEKEGAAARIRWQKSQGKRSGLGCS